jgi:phosphoribosylaminoimidazolecarboxamide formyltransferase/IMP cyclohydrolase
VTIKIVHIGLGIRGSHWLQFVAEHPDTESIACVDADAAALERAKTKVPGKCGFFSGVAEALAASGANAALLTSPSQLHTAGFAQRSVAGGLLLQTADATTCRMADARVVTKRAPSNEEREALDFIWRVAKHVKSNAIVYGRGQVTAAIGAGQMSRVDSSRIAALKAEGSLQGTVVASDAFFPFRDGLDILAEAGATAVVQPGGSVRDEEVITAANEHGMAMLFTGIRHFRH